MKPKKRILFLLAIFLLLVISSLTIWMLNRKSPFRNFCDSLFIEEMQGDTLSLHYTLAWPEEFHIDEKTCLPIYSRENALAGYEHTEKQLEKLTAFSEKDLSLTEAYTHTLLKKALANELKGQQFFYLQEVFSPSGGTQVQFPILMAEYPFRCKEDIEDYLEILKLTPSYFSSLCEFEKEKFAKGFGMPDYSLDKVINQCNTLITEESLQNNDHFLITTFSERLLDAVDNKVITKKEASSYATQNIQDLATYFLPAYEDLASSLSSFYGMGKNENGLSNFADGNAYYEWLFGTITGSDTNVEEAYKILAQNYYDSMLSLREELHVFQ